MSTNILDSNSTRNFWISHLQETTLKSLLIMIIEHQVWLI
jgi:hypothetical protein